MKVKLTITESRCREGYCRAGDVFFVDGLCPPLCHELWSGIYPQVFALLNGAELDYGETRARCFDAACPDGGRVKVHGELCEAENEKGKMKNEKGEAEAGKGEAENGKNTADKGETP